MRRSEDLSVALKELEKTELLTDPEVWQDGGRGSWTREYQQRKRHPDPHAKIPTAGTWVCHTWLCRACGARMWAEQTPWGQGWFGGGKPGCCWLQANNNGG